MRIKQLARYCIILSILIVVNSAVSFAQDIASNQLDSYYLDLTQEEKQWIEDNKTITVAFDGDFAPYSFIDSQGNFKGIAVDVTSEIARRTGLDVKIYPDGVWKNLYEAALNNEVDVIATLTQKPAREDLFHFTEPYLSLAQYVISSKKQ